jgi:hypothetical protein
VGLHTDTEIYRTAYELLKVSTEAARNMPRDVKLLVGGKIRDELLEAFDAMYAANVARDKVPHIDLVRRSILRVELLLRQSVDMRFITRPAYSRAVELTRSIGKQATAWKKYSASHAPAT